MLTTTWWAALFPLMKNPFNFESEWQSVFLGWLEKHTIADAAHDPQHVRRVVANARRLCVE